MVNLGNFLQIKEKEIKNTITNISDSLPLVIGDFEWGPVENPQLVQSNRNLAEIFGLPYILRNDSGTITNNNEKEWFTVDNLLNYGGSVLVDRILDDDSSYNSHYFIPSGGFHGKQCKVDFTNHDGDVTSITNGHTLKVSSTNSNGDTIEATISQINNITGDEYSIVLTDLNGYISDDMSLVYYGAGETALYSVELQSGTTFSDVIYDDVEEDFSGEFDNSVKSLIKNDDVVINGSFVPVLSDADLVRIFGRYAGEKGDEIYITYCNSLAYDDFEYVTGRKISNQFNVSSIGEKELAILVLEKSSSGTYSVLESHIVSLDVDAKDGAGNSKYIEDYLLQNSSYIYGYVNSSNLDISATGLNLNTYALYFEEPQPLQDGAVVKGDITDLTNETSRLEEYSGFEFKYIVDSGFLETDEYKKALIDLANERLSAIAMIGLPTSSVSSYISGTKSSAITSIKSWFKEFNVRVTRSAFAGEYKYKFNRYTGKYFWTHMADDLAGVCIYSDENFTPYASAMGYDFGIVRDTTIQRLGINYSGDLLDEIYRIGLNPMILDNEGIVCLGNKTGYADYTSDYSELHVRRMLIYIEKNISVLAKRIIGTYNDEFTRARFRDSAEQFLDRIVANRGISEYLVICDDTNNTGAVLDNKEFVGDLYIKATPLSEFVRVNIISVGNSVSFSEEIVG